MSVRAALIAMVMAVMFVPSFALILSILILTTLDFIKCTHDYFKSPSQFINSFNNALREKNYRQLTRQLSLIGIYVLTAYSLATAIPFVEERMIRHGMAVTWFEATAITVAVVIASLTIFSFFIHGGYRGTGLSLHIETEEETDSDEDGDTGVENLIPGEEHHNLADDEDQEAQTTMTTAERDLIVMKAVSEAPKVEAIDDAAKDEALHADDLPVPDDHLPDCGDNETTISEAKNPQDDDADSKCEAKSDGKDDDDDDDESETAHL